MTMSRPLPGSPVDDTPFAGNCNGGDLTAPPPTPLMMVVVYHMGDLTSQGGDEVDGCSCLPAALAAADPAAEPAGDGAGGRLAGRARAAGELALAGGSDGPGAGRLRGRPGPPRRVPESLAGQRRDALPGGPDGAAGREPEGGAARAGGGGRTGVGPRGAGPRAGAVAGPVRGAGAGGEVP